MNILDISTNPDTDLKINYEGITNLFKSAEEEERNSLFEHETYDLLKKTGMFNPPLTMLLEQGSEYADRELTSIPGDRVVIKIVSPYITHKTETGGIRIIPNSPEVIRSARRTMPEDVSEKYAAMIENNQIPSVERYRGLKGRKLCQAILKDIRGVLIVQYMPDHSGVFGNELIVCIRNSREFGMIISAGLGGTDTELFADGFRKGRAMVSASTTLTSGKTFFELFKNTISYQKLAGLTREQARIVPDNLLLNCFTSFIAVANYFSILNPDAPYVIEELEINPFSFNSSLIIPLDGLCRFSRPGKLPVKRPFKKIHNLLHPGSIGIMGVSATRMNYGRIILDNIIANGFRSENIRLIHRGMDQLDNIRCVPDLKQLDIKLDLLVVALSSEEILRIVEEVVEYNVTESVMLIAGGVGETRESGERAFGIMEKMESSHLQKGGGPVFLGANCLGIISHPGKYDTMFIPEEKLPKQRGEYKRNTAFISQSGAFMITRLSKRPELDPAYMVSIGNQNDLTFGDMLSYFKDKEDIHVIGVYAEGFKDLDGLTFAGAVRDAVKAGKDVIFYKAGRTSEGKNATAGHTASIAGDYIICESCVRQAGGIVADGFTLFEELLVLSQRLHDKTIKGNRLAALSGAGFEAVGMADNIRSNGYKMEMAVLSDSTKKRLSNMLKDKQLEHLTEAGNPLDINPSADDDTHIRAIEYVAEDPNVDIIVAGLDPLSPVTRTLSESGSKKYNFKSKGSMVMELPKLVEKLEKPVIGVINGGRLYDPMVDELAKKGMVIFRSADRAVRALAVYINGRLFTKRINQRGDQ
jgi:acyl-CoA synthetase (NDP forming)